MILIIMGVSGSGKTTVGKLIAFQKSCSFYDADDYHPANNKTKMVSGIALDDKERWPWLNILREKINEWVLKGNDVVLACSALKKAHRDHLVTDVMPFCSPDNSCLEKRLTDSSSQRNKEDVDEVWFVYLKGSKEVIRRHLSLRRGHFMPESLLASQFEDLEEPVYPSEKCLTIPIIEEVEQMVENIIKQLRI